MATEIGFADLAELAGEVLPERAVLGVVTTPGSNADVYYACQTTHYEGTQGLLGATGLGQPPHTTTTCMPAAIDSHG